MRLTGGEDGRIVNRVRIRSAEDDDISDNSDGAGVSYGGGGDEGDVGADGGGLPDTGSPVRPGLVFTGLSSLLAGLVLLLVGWRQTRPVHRAVRG